MAARCLVIVPRSFHSRGLPGLDLLANPAATRQPSLATRVACTLLQSLPFRSFTSSDLLHRRVDFPVLPSPRQQSHTCQRTIGHRHKYEAVGAQVLKHGAQLLARDKDCDGVKADDDEGEGSKGPTKTVKIFCSKCREMIYKYRKGGNGALVKCFVERIVEDHTNGDMKCGKCGSDFARLRLIKGKPAHKIIGGKVFFRK